MDMAKHINKISLKSFLISFLCSKQFYDIQKTPKFKTHFFWDIADIFKMFKSFMSVCTQVVAYLRMLVNSTVFNVSTVKKDSLLRFINLVKHCVM